MRFLFFLLMIFSYPAFSQEINHNIGPQIPDSVTLNTDAFAKFLKSNFKTEETILNALFHWEAQNITYDIENMMKSNPEDNHDKIIQKTLNTRKAVCQGFCETFNEISRKAGLNTYIILGYTRQNSQIDKLSHSWIAARIGKNWYLYDPTWAAGFMNDGKFIRHYNESWYKVSPNAIIETHIPFDPIWQFRDYPVTPANWQQKNYTEKIKYFNISDSIKSFEQQDIRTQFAAEIRRIEENEITNQLIYDRLKYLNRQISIIDENSRITLENSMVDDFNSSVTHYNQASTLYNKYVSYKNKSFKPAKPPDEIRLMLKDANSELSEAIDKLSKVSTTEKDRNKDIILLQNAFKQLGKHIQQEKSSLEILLKKKKK